MRIERKFDYRAVPERCQCRSSAVLEHSWFLVQFPSNYRAVSGQFLSSFRFPSSFSAVIEQIQGNFRANFDFRAVSVHLQSSFGAYLVQFPMRTAVHSAINFTLDNHRQQNKHLKFIKNPNQINLNLVLVSNNMQIINSFA